MLEMIGCFTHLPFQQFNKSNLSSLDSIGSAK
uniref:Uncharacterized protein n=1 Tax=Rhizophora mucronata TaxID=61149 RepID=A0A2P2NJ28_RHIMU